MPSYTQISALDDALAEIKEEFSKGAYMKKVRSNSAKDSWGGANVIVTTDKHRKGWEGDLVLITPHADIVGWYFKRIMSVAYTLGGIDYFSKHSFFHDLAKSVADLTEGADENMVFNTLIAKTREILMASMDLSENSHAPGAPN